MLSLQSCRLAGGTRARPVGAVFVGDKIVGQGPSPALEPPLRAAFKAAPEGPARPGAGGRGGGSKRLVHEAPAPAPPG